MNDGQFSLIQYSYRKLYRLFVITKIHFLIGTPIYVKAGETAVLTSSTLPKTSSNKDLYNGVLWRGPDGNVLLPGRRKYDMKIVTNYESSGIECKRAEITITCCEWEKDSGDYSVSLVPSSTSDDTSFVCTISLFVRCKSSK